MCKYGNEEVYNLYNENKLNLLTAVTEKSICLKKSKTMPKLKIEFPSLLTNIEKKEYSRIFNSLL